ncbi:MAG: ergothioneine biosynthesis protein EgtB [Gammaproteobacteria bacterium]|nr:ergothioneine biosynthesis protein EgtB [Gammaproteobacteria bacterium]MYD80729.1 ergothioneine biosynthesis protein EgtB [Gammaproteobacteria bacterium]
MVRDDNPQAIADIGSSYRAVRARSEELCGPLEVEDYCVQPIPEVSPIKWHLAHTTWFFEAFILQEYCPNYRVFNSKFNYLFNSYYESIGNYFPRPERGNLTRPLVKEIYEYRRHVDQGMSALLKGNTRPDVLDRVTLGLNHEQQHQELMVTDFKYILGKNPLRPSYNGATPKSNDVSVDRLAYSSFDGGMASIGIEVDGHSFCFDNETPKHRVYLAPYSLSNRLITNGEFEDFIRDGGYDDPRLWLSDGWLEKKQRGWSLPEYWSGEQGDRIEYTLSGERELDLAYPVTHISFYEADAFARWAGARLATEFEWEHATESQCAPIFSSGTPNTELHPQPASEGDQLKQLIGDCWEWTSSSYSPYPGYVPLKGALGEYNGKFMANQFVLRGGSVATPPGHIRTTYRNFFYAHDRWQFTGIRLARDVD